MRKKRLSLENIIKQRDMKNRLEKKKLRERKNEGGRDQKGGVGGRIKTLQNPRYLFI